MTTAGNLQNPDVIAMCLLRIVNNQGRPITRNVLHLELQ